MGKHHLSFKITKREEENVDVPIDNARTVPACVTVGCVLPGPIRKPTRQEQESITRGGCWPLASREHAAPIRRFPTAVAPHGSGDGARRLPLGSGLCVHCMQPGQPLQLLFKLKSRM